VLKQVNPNAYQLKLPEQYKLFHDVFSAHDMRPWLPYELVPVSKLYAPVQSHPRLNPVVQVMDCKQAGQSPPHCEDLLDYPTKCQVLLKDGRMEWMNRACLTASHERLFVMLSVAEAQCCSSLQSCQRIFPTLGGRQ
jgi:hypothetical protein